MTGIYYRLSIIRKPLVNCKDTYGEKGDWESGQV